MNKNEAAQRLEALISAHIELLEDLGLIRTWLRRGDYDSNAARHELVTEVHVHTRKLWSRVRSKTEFEMALFNLESLEEASEHDSQA